MTIARCAERSVVLDEPMAGTASRIRRYLLIEVPGPWGVEALRDARLPDALKRELRRRSRASGVRVLLIRRVNGPRTVRQPQVFVVDVNPAQPMAFAGRLSDVHDVLDLDVWGWRRETSVGHEVRERHEAHTGLERHSEALILVCTHGRHDPCCAERGRPVVRALSEAYPEQTWECSHMGGDRFAGNLLCLPDGVVYGRVTPGDAPTIAREYVAGRIDLAHLRGRGSYPFAVQAAEWHLRTELGLTGVRELLLTGHDVDGRDVTAVFTTTSGATWSVQVRITHAPPRRLTCHAENAFAAPQFQLLHVNRL